MKSTEQKDKKPSGASGGLEQAERWIADEATLVAAIAEANKRVEASQIKVDASRSVMAEAQADALLRGKTLDTNDPATQGFYQNVGNLERDRAALAALERRLAARDPEIAALLKRIEADREQYNREQVSAFLEEQLGPALAALAPVLRAGAALEEALGCEIPELHRAPDGGDWHVDESASEVYRQHNRPRETAEQLKKFDGQAKMRRLVEERSRSRRAGFDPQARYRVVRRFVNFGREFQAGTFVDAYSVDVTTLSRLYEGKYLEQISKSEELTLGGAKG